MHDGDHTRRGRLVPVLAIGLLACGLGAAQARADDPPPITVPTATTTSAAPAPDPSPATAPAPVAKPAPKPAPKRVPKAQQKPAAKPTAKAPAVHRAATVQRPPVSVVHPRATNVAPARVSVTPTHVVTRTPARKHPTKALVKAKPRLKPQAHVKAAVHTVRTPAAPKATPHLAAAVPASDALPGSGPRALAWFLVFAIVAAIGLGLFVAGRSILGHVSRASEGSAADEAPLRPS